MWLLWYSIRLLGHCLAVVRWLVGHCHGIDRWLLRCCLAVAKVYEVVAVVFVWLLGCC